MPGSTVKIYECRVQSVDAVGRTITVRSIKGRKFVNVSYLLPYIAAAGTGIDLVPEVGSTCIVLGAAGSDLNVVIGFRLTLAEGGEGRELGGRIKDLPEGAMGFRVKSEDGSEAKLICYPGGTAVVGSGKRAVTVYSNAGDIRHLFNSWQMTGPGGHMKWSRKEGSKKVSYSSEYRVNTKAAEPGLRVNVDIADGDTPFRVAVTRQQNDPRPAFEVSVDKDGVARIKGNVIELNAFARFEVLSPNVILNGRRLKPTKEPF